MTIIEPGDVRPGDTIRITTKRGEVTVTEEGVVGTLGGSHGLTAYTAKGAYIGRLGRFPAPDCVVYLLDRPKPAPKQLADMQPGLVIDNRGDSWVFDGGHAYRMSPSYHATADLFAKDEGQRLAPWKQAATLDYNTAEA